MILRTISLVAALSAASMLAGCGDSGDAEAACNTGICGDNSTLRNACLSAVDQCTNAGGSSSQCADAAREACNSSSE